MFPCAQLPRARAAGPTAGAATEALSASSEDEAAEFLWGLLRAKREWMEVGGTVV